MADTTKSHEPQNSPSRRALRSFFSCKYHKDHTDQQKQKKHKKDTTTTTTATNKTTSVPSEVSKRRASTSECHITKSVSSNSISSLTTTSSTNSSVGGSFRVMHLRRLSGCYECRMVMDPNGSGFRGAVSSCADCGEIFLKPESLELHRSIRHAVSELGPEDTSRNIIQIIFQSSWLKKQTPTPKIDRILKIHNTKSTTSNFELYRSSIKVKAASLPKKHPRCIADGNELLRFYSTTFTCNLGLNGSTSLCGNFSHCKVCSTVKNGLKPEEDESGMVKTWGRSGKAHDSVVGCLKEGEKRAMLVCRVIAGRVKKEMKDGLGDKWDSIMGKSEVSCVELDELLVVDGRAVLPCFVVVYRDF